MSLDAQIYRTLIKKAILLYIQNELVDRISKIATSSDYTQTLLSERLANAGLLPMFGFPTRTRNLYLSKPSKSYQPKML